MSKHIDPRHQDPDITNLTDVPSDLERNPGIGASKGSRMAGVDPHEIDADSTSEGDVANETNPQGGVDPRHLGRTNK